mmetsp:Transcript_2706/g.6143  ORF Transcript_2706/g.6143 Transcript_2706/m.6143 type:complete len:159 (-) Transcript_2706:201-677(-)|eukprot:s1078_g5.t2
MPSFSPSRRRRPSDSRRRRSRSVRRHRDSRSPPPRRSKSRQRSPQGRAASPSRSRSEDRKTRPVITPGGGIESVEAKVVDARTRHSGEPTFQAEVYLGLDAAAAGRQRTMCIRGPCRVDRGQAQEDADKMEEAAKDGIKAVREMAAKMKRSRISTTPA